MNLRKKIMFLAAVVCPAILTIVVPQDAYGYGYQIKTSNGTKIVWASKAVTFSCGKKSFPAGSPYRDALTEAIYLWNQTPANFTFGVNWGDGSLKRGNGQNEAWFSDNPSALKDSPAVCWRWKYSSGGKLWWSEADIIFDADEAWSPYSYPTSLWPYGGPYRPFVTTALHEMGHAMGLNHENRFYNVMGEDYTHIHTDQLETVGYAGSDATQGALFLYGKSGKYGWKEDVAVTHWMYGGKDGEYSKHKPTAMIRTDMWKEVDWEMLSGFKLYHVKPGTSYHAGFTFENTGYSDQPIVKMAGYISTNKAISTFDRFIGSTEINLPAGAVWTTTVQLTIPADLKVGMIYYLGVVVDYQNNIGEFNEGNNSSFHQIKIISP